ncbi:family A1 protease [Stereum hirsutum FP-91666 SS1]|uniref:family A1 protease n=1 Tax=Stereum hirsutum (strain FP-91666) TaxID=721885 RepID=UPI000440A21E|nr:family A1 protease [Stereum hirsutum FP-91666 SS1]EIM87245.1 family A1 protease [Stereum hirsutum FP-91666 SS1]
MFSPVYLVSIILATALNVAASPTHVVRDSLVTLPFAKVVNVTSPAHLIKHGQARARLLRDKARAKQQGLSSDAVVSAPAENEAVSYVANVAVGSPATTYQLIVDTGSSNTWVGAGKAFVRTGTSTPTINAVSVTYGSGSFFGQEFTDQVSLGPGLTVTEQSIGVAEESTGFDGVDGIIGIGPVDLTEGTLIPSFFSTIPTVTDNLFTQGAISAREVAVSFEPTTNLTNVNGELTFGGTDSSKFTGDITFTPVTTTSPSSEFWGIDESITYGTDGASILSTTAGIVGKLHIAVDTGTTLILIASDALALYETATGAVPDSTTGLLRLTTAQFANLQPLNFIINGATFTLTPNAQIWPRALNSAIGGTADNATLAVYLIVGDIGANSGSGMDFINGQTFLERFYSVFDTTNQRVGIAATPFTTSTVN